MKKVAYLVGKLSRSLSHPVRKELYQEPTRRLFELAHARGVQFIITDHAWYKNGKFHGGFVLTGNAFHFRRTAFTPDAALDKSTLKLSNLSRLWEIADHVTMVNHPLFALMCDHKHLSYLTLSEFMPKSVLVTPTSGTAPARLLRAKQVVVKPVFGSGGTGVYIISRKTFLKKRVQRDMVVQEFIDGSHGVAGLTSGYHDLRVVMVDGKISYCYLRIPKGLSRIANIAQGGTMQDVSLTHIPAAVRTVVRRIDKKFQEYDRRVYTLDFVVDKKGKPWLIEINSKPGIYFYPRDKKVQDRFYSDLISLFA